MSRMCYTKKMKRIVLPFLLFALMTALAACESRGPQPVQATAFAMDTVMTLTVYGDRGEEAVAESIQALNRLEGLFSVTRRDSDVARINAGGGGPVQVSRETGEVLRMALEFWEETGGAFSPGLFSIQRGWGFTTGEFHILEEEERLRLLDQIDVAGIEIEGQRAVVPPGTEVDFGAIAKGYAMDVLRDIMEEFAVESAIFSLGGEVFALGQRPGGGPWRIALQNPQGEGYIGVIEVVDKTVSTSGSYERWFLAADGRRIHHILDPQSGKPVENGLISVTAVAREGARGDALSTALFVMGLEEGLRFVEDAPDIEAIFVTEGGDIYVSSGLAENFVRL